MTEMQVEQPAASFKNRRPWLIFFGIVEVLIGVFCMLIIALTVLSLKLSSQFEGAAETAPAAVTMISTVSVYGLLAVFFIWMGIGTMLARRWARAIMLVVSWVWLITGIIGMTAWFFMMPTFYAQMQQAGVAADSAVLRVITIVTGALMAVVYLILPSLFILFYRGGNVKATCEALDPHERWTDRCPLPVLAVGLLCLYGALSCLMMMIYGVLPLVGQILTGLPAIGVSLVLALLFAWVATSVYRMHPLGWWAVFVGTVLGFLNMVFTFTRVDMVTFYEAMGFAGQQLEAVKQYGMFTGPNMIAWSGIPTVLMLGYLLWVRRYFRAAA